MGNIDAKDQFGRSLGDDVDDVASENTVERLPSHLYLRYQ